MTAYEALREGIQETEAAVTIAGAQRQVDYRGGAGAGRSLWCQSALAPSNSSAR